MRVASLIALVLMCAAPARAQWTPVPLPPQVVSPAQVALFGFAEAFGGSLFVSTGFGTSLTPALSSFVIVSRDGGATWATVPEFDTNTADRIGRPTVADGVLYVPSLGRYGQPPAARSTVLKTTDGTSWTVPAASGLIPADDVLTNVARQGGVLYGHAQLGNGNSETAYVYRSADEGATWTRVGTPGPSRRLYSAGSVLLRGSLGTEIGQRSADGGVTWTSHGTQIYTVARSSAGVTLAGALGSVRCSTDGGATFAAVPAAATGFGGSLALGACNAAFVGVIAGVVKRSDDGGTTWTAWGDGLPGSGSNVLQLSCSAGGPSAGGPTYVYAATTDSGGAGAGVYRRDLSQMQTAAADTPEAARFALAAGPNPAAHAATLRFALDAAQTVRVTVTDTLGRTVLALDRALAAGPQALPLDVSALAPGVYVARVTTSGASASVRLTLTR